MPQKTPITIIGAGIGGVSTALELVKLGHKVRLIEAKEEILDRTSNITPGRLGLGFHYPGDSSHNTAKDVIRGALEFKKKYPDMLIKNASHQKNLTHGWYFLVKNSYLSESDFIHYCNSIKTIYEEICDIYKFNFEENQFFRRLSVNEFDKIVSLDKISVGIETYEELVDWPKFKWFLTNEIVNNGNIEVLNNRWVTNIEDLQGSFLLSLQHKKNIEKIESQILINATCEYRLKIDEMIGHVPKEQWVNRLKLVSSITLPNKLKEVHSIFFTQGPFAMFTNWGNGNGFLTYAPITNMGTVHGNDIPEYWEHIISKGIDLSMQKVIGRSMIEGISQFIPTMKNAKLNYVKAGVVHHSGTGNIYDPKSGIHKRTDTGYYKVKEGFYSLNIGKLVFAPMYAKALAYDVNKTVTKNRVAV